MTIRSYITDKLRCCAEIDVSIVTVCHDPEALEEALAFLLCQSLQNWEWIIVDCSGDEESAAGKISLSGWADERISIIQGQGLTPGAARNIALSSGRGRYVCFLDQGDEIEPTFLEKCLWFLETNQEFSFCNSYTVFKPGNIKCNHGFELGEDYFKDANKIGLASVIRCSALNECGGFDDALPDDHAIPEFWVRMAQAGHWGYSLREYLHGRRTDLIIRAARMPGLTPLDPGYLVTRRQNGFLTGFPSPHRRHPVPYETVQWYAPICNPLQANAKGRSIMFLVPWMVEGGADKANLDFIDGLVSMGHDVTICATMSSEHKWADAFTRLTPDIFILPNLLHLSDYPRFLAYLIDSRKIDTVFIAGSTIGYQLLPYLRAILPGVAFVDICHVEEPHWLNGGHPRFAVGYQDAIDINIITSGHLFGWMEKRGADPGKIRLINTGVRIRPACLSQDELSLLQQRYDLEVGLPTIVFAGRLCEQKRPVMLAEILKAARDEGVHYNALIVGDGELRPRLESLLDVYELRSNTKMLGSVPHEQWLEILSLAQILILPSLYEGISVALIEAMAAGVIPVIAKVGGQEALVESNAGFLIPHGESEIQEYASVLRRLTGNPDEMLVRSARCRDIVVTRYTWESSMEKLDQVMDEAHHMRDNNPGQEISLGLAREWATLAIESSRLSNAVNWLWNRQNPEAGGQDAAMVSENVPADIRLFILFKQSRLGGLLFGSKILNAIGRRILAGWEMRKE